MIKKIAVFTGTRAEYGLLKNLMQEIESSDIFELKTIVSGSHLSERFGNTWKQIESDGFKISEKIDINLSSDSSQSIISSIGECLVGIGKALEGIKPDLLVVLGDRYEATERIPDEIINAALPYVDILSFQDFKNPINNMNYWYKKTGKPILLADSAKMKWDTLPGEISKNDGDWYAMILSNLQNNPGCVGFHLCGSYQRNRSRRYGLIDEQEIPDKKSNEERC